MACYTELAEQKNVDAQDRLATCYQLGIGFIEADFAKAIYWYKEAIQLYETDEKVNQQLKLPKCEAMFNLDKYLTPRF